MGETLPLGVRRLDIVVHTKEDVARVLAEAEELLDGVEGLADADRPQLRLLLVQMLGNRSVQLVPDGTGSSLALPGNGLPFGAR